MLAGEGTSCVDIPDGGGHDQIGPLDPPVTVHHKLLNWSVSNTTDGPVGALQYEQQWPYTKKQPPPQLTVERCKSAKCYIFIELRVTEFCTHSVCIIIGT